jgi:hypothetical protein
MILIPIFQLGKLSQTEIRVSWLEVAAQVESSNVGLGARSLDARICALKYCGIPSFLFSILGVLLC